MISEITPSNIDLGVIESPYGRNIKRIPKNILEVYGRF